jgi:hypothetical protein
VSHLGGVDMARTLNELDPPDWGPAPSDATGLVAACHTARQKPVDELTIENLRVLIGQKVALNLLIPLAIRRLSENPLSEGDMYPGDLLKAVLTADPEFWRANAELAYEVEVLVDNLDRTMDNLREPIAQFRSSRFPTPL